MNDKKINMPAIIIAAAAVLIIGGLLVFGIVFLNGKNNEIDDMRKELSSKTNELSVKNEELTKESEELSKTKEELDKKLKELDETIEQAKKVTAERDRLVEEDEARKKAEADTTASDEAEKEAIENMLAIMDEVIDLQEQVTNINIDESDSENIVDYIDAYCTKFDKCAANFMVLKDVPSNFYSAGKEWMELNMVCFEEIRDLYAFFIGYLNSTEQLSEFIGIMDKESLSEDWIFDSMECIEQMETGIKETQCPAYLAPIWERWGNAVSLNNEFINRMVEGIYVQDYLKVYSAYNLIRRILTIMSNLGDEMGKSINEELFFADSQIDKGGLIYDEINEAKSLPYGERSSYVFKNKYDGEVSLTYKTIDNIYPSLYNTYDHFVTIEAGCITGKRDIVVECEIPGLTQKFEQKFSLTSHLQPIYIKPPAATQLKSLDKAWDSTIKINIKDITGNIIDAKSFQIHIYSANDFKWNDDEFGVCTQDNILCFISPESEAVTELKRKAIDILDELSDGAMSAFSGYQGPVYSEYIDTFMYAASLMMAMSDLGVRYNMDPFSIDGADQHILFPQQVLEQKSGLCVETSLVIASALQSAGMHTYLVFPEGHAQVAVETWEYSGEYFLIETTDIPCSWENFTDYLAVLFEGEYDNTIECPVVYLTKEGWENYIEALDVYLVDCSDGKMLGLTPFAF